MNTTTLFRTVRIAAGWTDPWGASHEVEVVAELVHVELIPGLIITRNDGYQICEDSVWQDARGHQYVQQRNMIDYSGGCTWRGIAALKADATYWRNASDSRNQNVRTMIDDQPVTVESLCDRATILSAPSFI